MKAETLAIRGSVADQTRPEYLTNRRRQELAYQRRLSGMTLQEVADSPHPDNPALLLYASRGAALKASGRPQPGTLARTPRTS